MAIISLLVAVSDNGLIGRDNQLPWHLPADLKRFKRLSLGKPVLMGRKTWESLGRPLPERRNIVITRNRDYRAPGAEVTGSLEEAIRLAGDAEEIMVIGGAEIFRLALPLADRMYYTHVHTVMDGDTFFPPVD
ncbi:MAG: dihydrofolate reductase, partial [Burkholderiales bacterium]|nr:dihydrofolate reductase [Burkholderiales bacterium]